LIKSANSLWVMPKAILASFIRFPTLISNHLQRFMRRTVEHL